MPVEMHADVSRREEDFAPLKIQRERDSYSRGSGFGDTMMKIIVVVAGVLLAIASAIVLPPELALVSIFLITAGTGVVTLGVEKILVILPRSLWVDKTASGRGRHLDKPVHRRYPEQAAFVAGLMENEIENLRYRNNLGEQPLNRRPRTTTSTSQSSTRSPTGQTTFGGGHTQSAQTPITQEPFGTSRVQSTQPPIRQTTFGGGHTQSALTPTSQEPFGTFRAQSAQLPTRQTTFGGGHVRAAQAPAGNTTFGSRPKKED